MIRSNNQKDPELFNKTPGYKEKNKGDIKEPECTDSQALTKTEVKNAHATGLGALERSEENLLDRESSNLDDDLVY